MDIGPVYSIPKADDATKNKIKDLGLSLKGDGLQHNNLGEDSSVTVSVNQEANNFLITLDSTEFDDDERLMFKVAYEVRLYITSNGQQPGTKQIKEMVKRYGGDPSKIIDRVPKKINKKPKPNVNIKDLVLDDKPKTTVWNELWNTLIKGW